jgi:hypothetical protein
MNINGKATKVSWALRLSTLLLAACSFAMIGMMFPFADLLYRHHLQSWDAVVLTLWAIIAGICLLLSVVLSLVSLFRRDWFGIIGLLAAALAAAGVILVIKGLSTGEI